MVAEQRAQRAFLLSAIAHAEFDALAAHGPELERRLNDEIDLADYSDTIKQVQIVPLLLAHDSPMHAAEFRFDAVSGELLLSPRLGPDRLAGVDVDRYPTVLAEALCSQTSEWGGVPGELVARIGAVISGSAGEGGSADT
jgi:hypothetical protein